MHWPCKSKFLSSIPGLASFSLSCKKEFQHNLIYSFNERLHSLIFQERFSRFLLTEKFSILNSIHSIIFYMQPKTDYIISDNPFVVRSVARLISGILQRLMWETWALGYFNCEFYICILLCLYKYMYMCMYVFKNFSIVNRMKYELLWARCIFHHLGL